MIYRALLRLYPAEFRQKYGDELEADFVTMCNEARNDGGRAAVMTCWLRAAGDVAHSAPREWLRTPWIPVLVTAACVASGIFYYVVGRIYRVRSFATVSQPPESPQLYFLMALMAVIPIATMILIAFAGRFVLPRRRGTRSRV